jgi:multidrug efflux pump subunit AcrA (membrane-fusion protein)
MCCVVVCSLATTAFQATGQDSKSAALPSAAAGDSVIVKRDGLHVLQPQSYRVPLWLEPIRSITLTAPFDGIVRQADTKPNSKVQAQTDIVRLDNTVAKFKLAHAEAEMRVAAAEQKLAADKDENQKALAQARVDVAKSEVDLAKYLLEQTSVRTPFSGELQRILVSEGQFVRAGDPVAIVVDSSKMRVEVPVERSAAVQGKSYPLKVESAEVEGKVEAVLPLSDRFKALRDLFDSIASATVVVDNPDGQYKAGQTVHVPIIPRQPIAEIRSSAISNLPDGQRKVQVVRHMVVRDIPVLVMGSVGVGRLYVSGAFADGDEVIYESSHQLSDAFQLRPAAAPANTGAAPSTTNPTTPSPAPTKPTVGF